MGQAKPDKWTGDRVFEMFSEICQEASGDAIEASAADLKECKVHGKPGGPIRHGPFLRWALVGGTEAAEVVQVIAGAGLSSAGLVDEPMRKPGRQLNGRWDPLKSMEKRTAKESATGGQSIAK